MKEFLFQNKKVKSLSIEHNYLHNNHNYHCITEESPFSAKIPQLYGSFTDRKCGSIKNVIHQASLSENEINVHYTQRNSILKNKLPSLHLYEFKKKDGICPKAKINQEDYINSQEEQTKAQLSVKKLNDLLMKKRIYPERIKQNYPFMYEMKDFSKQMQQIYKRNNVNPIKLKALPLQIETKNCQQIDFLINLLKKKDI